MFKPNEFWLHTTYNNINREVFHNILPPVKLKIKKNLKLRLKIKTKKGKKKFKKVPIWAYQQGCKIVMTHKFACEEMARDVLAHEMVHVWQACLHDDMHGTSFFMWKHAFKENNLFLEAEYSKKDYKHST